MSDSIIAFITGAGIAVIATWLQWKRERSLRAEERWADFQRQSLNELLLAVRAALIETAERYSEMRDDAHKHGVWPTMPLRPGWNRAHFEAIAQIGQISQIAVPLRDDKLTNILEQFREEANATIMGQTAEAAAVSFAQCQTLFDQANARIADFLLKVEQPRQSGWKAWESLRHR